MSGVDFYFKNLEATSTAHCVRSGCGAFVGWWIWEACGEECLWFAQGGEVRLLGNRGPLSGWICFLNVTLFRLRGLELCFAQREGEGIG